MRFGYTQSNQEQMIGYAHMHERERDGEKEIEIESDMAHYRWH